MRQSPSSHASRVSYVGPPTNRLHLLPHELVVELWMYAEDVLWQVAASEKKRRRHRAHRAPEAPLFRIAVPWWLIKRSRRAYVSWVLEKGDGMDLKRLVCYFEVTEIVDQSITHEVTQAFATLAARLPASDVDATRVCLWDAWDLRRFANVLIREAAIRGDRELVAWLLSRVEVSISCVEAAISRAERVYESACVTALQFALAEDHLELVRWLVRPRPRARTTLSRKRGLEDGQRLISDVVHETLWLVRPWKSLRSLLWLEDTIREGRTLYFATSLQSAQVIKTLAVLISRARVGDAARARAPLGEAFISALRSVQPLSSLKADRDADSDFFHEVWLAAAASRSAELMREVYAVLHARPPDPYTRRIEEVSQLDPWRYASLTRDTNLLDEMVLLFECCPLTTRPDSSSGRRSPRTSSRAAPTCCGGGALAWKPPACRERRSRARPSWQRSP